MSGKRQVSGMSPKQRAAVMISIRSQHGNRTPRARAMDARRTANRTLDPATDNLHPWQRHPNRYDVQGVDTRATVTPVKANKPEPKATKDSVKIITDNLHPWQRHPNRYDVQGVDTRATVTPVKANKPEPKATKDSVKIITNNMPDGYEIRKWSYKDQAGKHTVHAVIFEGKPVFGQNKTFGSLTDARKAVKEHADTQRLKKQIKEEREHFKKHGNLGKTGYIGKPLKKTPKTKKSSDVIGERPTGIVRNHLHKLWGQVHGDEQIGDFDTWMSEQSDKTYAEAKADLLRRGERRQVEMTSGEQARYEREKARYEEEMSVQSCDFHIKECDRGDLDDCRIACTECKDDNACDVVGL